MSLWEFVACVDGFAEFHGFKDSSMETGWTDDRARELGIEGF